MEEIFEMYLDIIKNIKIDTTDHIMFYS